MDNKNLHMYSYKRLLMIFLIAFIDVNCQNYGLKEPQDISTLPKSFAPVILPVRKEKVNEKSERQKTNEAFYTIKRGWELIDASQLNASPEEISKQGFNTDNWYNAIVPGTVLSTLIEQGVYPDPYFGINNLSIPDSLCRKNWWYRVAFELPKSEKSQYIWLNFEGINYSAEIWFNGKFVGQIKGAFIRGQFDITKYVVHDANNVLAVHIIPPPNPGIPHEESPLAGTGPNGGQLCLDGPTFISSEGWDWVPGIRDRNIGIWQDVNLRITGAVTLNDPQIITDLPLPDTTSAYLTVKTGVENNSDVLQNTTIKAVIGDVILEQKIVLQPDEKRTVIFSPDEFPGLHLMNPKLWWPNGYGKPNLYNLELSVLNEGLKISDSKNIRFGIRELSYILSIDTPFEKNKRIEYNPVRALASGKPVLDNSSLREVIPGTVIPGLRTGVDTSLIQTSGELSTAPYLVVDVNGQKIFCKGGNWGMDDGLKRVSRERLEPFIRLQRDANFTMIRNWTGESTEELFYELCDEYGLLVWNDFWLSTEGWNLEVNDNELFLENAEDVVKRFRNHPSIAIWCARNEGYPVKEIEEGLSQIIAQYDGTRLYQPNSRYLNLRPSGPWHYKEDAREYYSSIANGFSTELGTPSVPTAETMRSMMDEKDVWPISDVWWYHDLHDGQLPYRNDIDKLYGGPQESLEEFCTKAQMVNYTSHRAMFESWNSKLWDAASGLLLWMTHPAWPSTVWQIYSSDYETYASYYASKKACEPVHVQMNIDDLLITTINTTLKSYDNSKVSVGIFDTDANQLYDKTMNINLSANSRKDCFTLQLPPDMPEVFFVRLKLFDENKNLLSENLYWLSSNDGEKNFRKFNDLPLVTLTGSSMISEADSIVKINAVITNPGQTIALAVKLNLRNADTGERVLPAFIDDGYFTLFPGESKTVIIECDKKNVSANMALSAEGYNVPKQTVSVIDLDK